MAVKSNFAAGDVLTSSDVNTYLTNGGLVYITGTTLSGTATNITSCFSSTYANYRIIINSIEMSGTGDLYFQMLSGSTAITAADYAWAGLGWNTNAGGVNSAASGQTVAYLGWTQSGVNNTPIGSVTFDIHAPNLAQRTFVQFQASSYVTYFQYKTGMAEHNLTTAYDGIRFLSNSAVTMGGSVRVYGYRQA